MLVTVRMNGTMRTRKPIVTRLPQRILVDTGVFLAYYELSDRHHLQAVQLVTTWWRQPPYPSRLIVAFPVLYETLNTRFVQDRRRLDLWAHDWSLWRTRGRLEYCADEPYRLDALDQCVTEAQRPPQDFRALSVVDRILRALLDDPLIHLDGLWTFNPGDFADVCQRRDIRMNT